MKMKKILILLVFCITNFLSIIGTAYLLTKPESRGLNLSCVPNQEVAITIADAVFHSACPKELHRYFDYPGAVWDCKIENGVWVVSRRELDSSPHLGGGFIIKIDQETAEIIWIGLGA